MGRNTISTNKYLADVSKERVVSISRVKGKGKVIPLQARCAPEGG